MSTHPTKILRRINSYSTKDPNTGCINWVGHYDGDYGRIKVDGKKWRVHRLIWTLVRGCIPDGLYVLHSCDNPKCININHLTVGNAQDNMDDKVAKGRAKGNPPKLTNEDKLNIQLDNRTLKEIALSYNTSISVIHRAKREVL